MSGRFLGHFGPELRRVVVALYFLLLLLNIAAWVWAVLVFRRHSILLGTALLAYGLGLRHAVDADHIAAIDNVTRKLMQEGKRPATVGFLFALGHSSVVILAAAAVALAASKVAPLWGAARSLGSLIGTSVSAVFLLLIAVTNLCIFRSVWRALQQVRKGGTCIAEDFDLLLNGRGLTARLFRPLFRLVRTSWHMYFIGLLFGLGFDTATEVALLGVSATPAAQGTAVWAIMVFPVLFAAGMLLVDTTDGVLMLGAYQWALVTPVRKLAYNMVITLISVLVALGVGGIEALGLLGNRLHLPGGFWDALAALNGNFSGLGFIIIGIFVTSWTVSVFSSVTTKPTSRRSMPRK